MKPYYQDQWVTLYLGDAREILPDLGPADTVITDPVWPNARANLAGKERPFELLRETCALLNCHRIVLQFDT